MEFKQCFSCKELKSVSNFHKCSSKIDGLKPNCKSCIASKSRLYWEKIKDNIQHKQKRSQRKHQWDIENVLHRRNYHREYCKNRRLNDVNYNILISLRNRVVKILNGRNKSESTLVLLGCSIDVFRKHIETQFKDGMSWDNHGVYGWHIDHIRPCSYFDLSDPEQQKQCFHYTNLQPLWAEENLKKGSTILNLRN